MRTLKKSFEIFKVFLVMVNIYNFISFGNLWSEMKKYLYTSLPTTYMNFVRIYIYIYIYIYIRGKVLDKKPRM